MTSTTTSTEELFDIRRGDYAELDITIMRGSAPQPLADAKITFTIKRSTTDIDAAAVFTRTTDDGGIDVLDVSLGTCRVVIPSSVSRTFQLGTYFWDVQIELPDDEVHTALVGKMKVLYDITQTTGG